MAAPLHIVSLSFDDGFEKSSILTAEIFEQAGLRACLNVLAAPHLFVSNSPEAAPIKFGSFDLWNDLKSRGHEVMPHGVRHANKKQMPFEEAKSLITRCLDIFDAELRGFDRRRAIFNYPYNATTPELESWLATVVRASRGGGADYGINPIPTRETTVIRTSGFGPGNCEAHLDGCIAELLRRERGWLVYNPHGLDGEGWGPMDAAYLRKLLARLKAIPSVKIWSVGQTFSELGVMD